MDLSAVGKFIKSQRKEKGLTQEQLANKLMVSEKTISKWECSKGLPDANLMLPLCNALDISANELLCGKKLKETEYKQNAEENIVFLKNQNERQNKFLLTLEWILGYESSLSFLIFVFVASFVAMPTWGKIALIVLGFIQFFIGVHFCILIEKDAGFYQCACCHKRYVPTLKQMYFSMHFGRTRFMRCPHCHKLSWHKKVVEDDKKN